jgi:hypothetical protein
LLITVCAADRARAGALRIAEPALPAARRTFVTFLRLATCFAVERADLSTDFIFVPFDGLAADFRVDFAADFFIGRFADELALRAPLARLAVDFFAPPLDIPRRLLPAFFAMNPPQGS